MPRLSTRGNLVGDATSPVDPRLGPLKNNGGLTLTHDLLADSPAIDAGNPAFSGPPDRDQRDYDRVADGDRDGTAVVDIGAFEVAPLVVNGLFDEDDGNTTAGNLSFREAVNLANLRPGNDRIVFAGPLGSQTLLLTLGEIAITDAVTISGDVVINAGGFSRIFPH